jgi:hypothetical protein
MFRVVLDKLAPYQQLFYVQDSIHVMTGKAVRRHSQNHTWLLTGQQHTQPFF